MTQEQEMSFEEAMKQLEDVVSQLEHGDVPLEKAIDLFQTGMQLSQLCGQKLSQVERKIEMIVEEGGDISKKPFVPQTEESDSLG
ncbi:exodeoxyribonuclease VII small subunit [Fontibacillus solani]|uniref:Exodeoxyribonuclease 7 small subunit n=2 Tax=Fontibacillus TaxID=995014 RepID=A0A1G7R8I1_9BACL|nr:MULTISPECIES: exodeoxyribonuclease VII small subunit [Fontibacillus]MBA9088406.1 exodeoxyribonuclease VII small subunit [Fontibacillus solani]SDG07047.1 Exodeoxyribonuclease VII small subunit [Fontibacillus panacisegetis]